jgi:hypothetical protein
LEFEDITMNAITADVSTARPSISIWASRGWMVSSPRSISDDSRTVWPWARASAPPPALRCSQGRRLPDLEMAERRSALRPLDTKEA